MSYFHFLLRAALVWICVKLFLSFRKFRKFQSEVNKIPGPKTIPMLGNANEMLQPLPEIFSRLSRGVREFGPFARYWLVNRAMIMVTRARDIEVIIQGMTHHAKSLNYGEMFGDWLGNGLLTSKDEQWRIHRKILTPAFHFNILHEFLPIFNKHAVGLGNQLASAIGRKSYEGVNVFKYVCLCSLDIICESSMGLKIEAQKNSKSPYVQGIISLTDAIMKRWFTPWLRPPFLYKFSETKKETDRCLRIVNQLRDQVIEERKQYLKERGFANIATDGEDTTGQRRRLAFIDLLLCAQAQDPTQVTNQDIKDQTSTFLFEGHDTVATATCWALFMLGTHPKIQEKVVSELEEVFGDSGRSADMNDLSRLKYLERCIKETLRLFPSVPFFERNIDQAAKAEHHTIPAGCGVSVNTYLLHRDHEFWPDPEVFDPDRFLPENSQGRHPYAYLPFSAGPRNCIGQKFAILEEKVIVSTILRRFKIEAAHPLEDAILQVGLVLRPKNGLKVRFFDRDTHPKLRVSSDMLDTD